MLIAKTLDSLIINEMLARFAYDVTFPTKFLIQPAEENSEMGEEEPGRLVLLSVDGNFIPKLPIPLNNSRRLWR